MNKAIKRRLEKLKERTSQQGISLIFITPLESGNYEVKHQDYTKGFTEVNYTYQSEEEAYRVASDIAREGDYILFFDYGEDDE